jgi:hypothetical protein
VELRDTDLSQIVPTAYHADLVVLLHQGKPVFGIVVEVQLGRDDDKRYTWPLYAAALRAAHRCPTCVMVVTPDAAVATWAAQAIDTGLPGSSFTPLVLGPGAVPWVTDVEEARRSPELAVLSAQAHGESEQAIEVAVAALAAAAGLDDERAMLYNDLVLAAVSTAARAKLEELMQNGAYEYQSDFAKRYLAQGRTEGRTEGRAEGRTEGRTEGLANAVLAVFAARDLAVTDDVRERILTCGDLETLERWLKRAVVAASAADIFAE